MRTLPALAALLVTLPLGVRAQETPVPAPPPGESESYLGVRLGAVSPQHSDLDQFENGFAFEVFIGRRFHPNFAVEGSVGRFAMGATATEYDPSVGTITLTAEMVAVPLVVSLKATYPAAQGELYADAGAGLYFMSFSMDGTVPGYSPVHLSYSDNPVAFHVGGGLLGRISPRVLIGLDLKYVIGDATFNGSSGSFDSLLLTGSISYAF